MKLEDTGTLAVRSFITDNAGHYHFYGLSPRVNYKVSAQYRGKRSDSKYLSAFETDRVATADLTIPNGR